MNHLILTRAVVEQMEAFAKRETIVFDIDGTIANVEHRLPFVTVEPKNWHCFMELSMMDEPIYHMRAVYYGLKSIKHPTISRISAYRIGFVTARNEEYRDITTQWLAKHNFDNYEFLHMRAKDDRRPDHIVKEEIYKTSISPTKDDKLAMWFDDKPTVVNHLRSLGCYVIDVGQTKNDPFQK